MDSIRIGIEANEEQQEILISELSELGAEGFEQTENKLIAYFNPHTLNSYEVNDLLKEYKFDISTIKEQNWNEVWESNFQPVTVNHFCAIRAEFHQPILNVKHDIIITPKMSFGTGHHATTYMMIEQMEDIDFTNKLVFDFGTGTGILSILAEKLGAQKIHATDIDDWSITNTEENAERNNCIRISVYLSPEIPEEKFDIILANINRNVIVENIPLLKKILHTKGKILLSGLLITDENDIVEACAKQGLTLVKRKERNKWISLLMVNGL
ncbi:MAG: 50S ribosomal protein L11 methyltransferase [Flavisolibacter sp.]